MRRSENKNNRHPTPSRSTLFPYTTLFRSAKASCAFACPFRRRYKTPSCKASERTNRGRRRGCGDRKIKTTDTPRHRDLHSFPTRRSSDLPKQAALSRALFAGVIKHHHVKQVKEQTEDVAADA